MQLPLQRLAASFMRTPIFGARFVPLPFLASRPSTVPCDSGPSCANASVTNCQAPHNRRNIASQLGLPLARPTGRSHQGAPARILKDQGAFAELGVVPF